MKMTRTFPVFVLTCILFASCDSSIDEQEKRNGGKCPFEIEIEVTNGSSFKYDSQTGSLSKLINPFEDQWVYADTTFYLTNDNRCEIMELFNRIDVFSYPDEYRPEIEFEITPEPAYKINLTIEGKKKTITWTENTETCEEAASNLRSVIFHLDSIIYTSSEFKSLPQQEYEWL